MDHFWPFGPFWTILDHFGLFLTILDNIWTVWTSLNQFEPIQPIWTNLIISHLDLISRLYLYRNISRGVFYTSAGRRRVKFLNFCSSTLKKTKKNKISKIKLKKKIPKKKFQKKNFKKKISKKFQKKIKKIIKKKNFTQKILTQKIFTQKFSLKKMFTQKNFCPKICSLNLSDFPLSTWAEHSCTLV